MVIIATAVVLTLVRRPSVASGSTRALDLALIACIAVIGAQIIPLPSSIRAALSPAAVAFDRAQRLEAAAAAARPLSIDPTATAWALVLAASVVLLFWCARAWFARGGVRTVVRGIAACGFVLAPLVVLQRYTAPRRLYWWWAPPVTNAYPYGPFVNRNDLACWLIIAIPVVIGYAIARIESRTRESGRLDVEAVVDATAIWLAGSIALMISLLFVTLSRSGLTGAAAGLCALMWISRSRLGRRRTAWVLSLLGVAVLIATSYANLGVLTTRIGDALTEGVGGRLAIWRQTWPMVRDFWPIGVGVGAYERGMAVYQTLPHLFYFNHAHNEYLQLLAEGGAPFVAAVAVAFGLAAWAVGRRLAADRSPAFWMRAGAASAMVAAAVQCIWETGLRVPANALLFALVAAIALHDDRPSSS